MSLMQILNKNEPNTVSCGTPLLILIVGLPQTDEGFCLSETLYPLPYFSTDSNVRGSSLKEILFTFGKQEAHKGKKVNRSITCMACIPPDFSQSTSNLITRHLQERVRETIEALCRVAFDPLHSVRIPGILYVTCSQQSVQVTDTRQIKIISDTTNKAVFYSTVSLLWIWRNHVEHCSH